MVLAHVAPARPGIIAGSQPALKLSFIRPEPRSQRPECHGGCNILFLSRLDKAQGAANISSKKKGGVQEGLVKMLGVSSVPGRVPTTTGCTDRD
jgi:hypothetical protein